MRKGFTPNHFCQNIKQMASHVKNGTGFTLMEILVSIAILAIIGMLILNVFARSMRGGNKAQILLAIKQNGQTVLDQMDRAIRNADEVVCVASTPVSCTQNASGSISGHAIVIVKDGVYTRYRFVSETASDNGKILQDNPTRATGGSEDEICSFISRICNPGDVISETVTLTDTNRTSGISVVTSKDTLGNSLDYYIIRNQLSGYKDSVTLQFALKQGVDVSGGVTTDIDQVDFKTTIQLR